MVSFGPLISQKPQLIKKTNRKDKARNNEGNAMKMIMKFMKLSEKHLRKGEEEVQEDKISSEKTKKQEQKQE